MPGLDPGRPAASRPGWPAHLARAVLFLGGAGAGLAGWMLGPDGWRWGMLIGGWLAGGILAERAFRRLASPAQIRADLRERVDSGD